VIVPADRMKSVQRSLIRRVVDAAPPGSIHLGLGEIRLPAHPLLKQWALEGLREDVHHYTPNAGLPELRALVAGQYGLPPEGACVAVGVEEALYDVLVTYIGPGDRVLLPVPTYPAYATIVAMCGGQAVSFNLSPEDGFGFNEAALDAALPGMRALLLCNPSNPLGTQLSADQVRLVAQACHRHGVLLIADEIYRDLWLRERGQTFAGQPGDVIVLGGLSKSHGMTGWRLGWAVGAPELIAPVINAHQYVCTCAPALSQRMALHALAPEGDAVAAHYRAELKANLALLLEGLRGLPFTPVPPDAAPYLLLRCGQPGLHRRALDAGVITIPGEAFGLGEGWIRLSYGIAREDLEEAIKRIHRVM